MSSRGHLGRKQTWIRAAGLFCAGLLATLGCDSAKAQDEKLAQREKEVFARAASLKVPLKAEDLGIPVPKPEEDAAPIVADISDMMKADRAMIDTVESLVKAQRSKRPTLQDLKPLEAILDKAEELENKTAFKRPDPAANFTAFAAIPRLGNAALLLAMRGYLRIEAKQDDKGLRDLSISLHICDLLAQGRGASSLVLSSGLRSRILGIMREAALDFRNNPKILNGIMALCADPKTPTLRQITEFAAFELYRDFTAWIEDVKENKNLTEQERREVVLSIRKWRVEEITVLCDLFEQADKSAWDAHKLEDSLRAQYLKGRKSAHEILPTIEEGFAIWIQMGRISLEPLALTRLTKYFIALVIQDYEVDKNPVTLKNVSAMNIDPYSNGKKFLTKQVGSDTMIYSVGYNGVDDGGVKKAGSIDDSVVMSTKFRAMPDDIAVKIPTELLP